MWQLQHTITMVELISSRFALRVPFLGMLGCGVSVVVRGGQRRSPLVVLTELTSAPQLSPMTL